MKLCIVFFFFVNLNFVILLNKMCYVDDDEFGWNSRWLDRVVKWHKKCKYDIVDNWESRRNSIEISMDFFKKKFLKFLVTCYYFFIISQLFFIINFLKNKMSNIILSLTCVGPCPKETYELIIDLILDLKTSC